MANKFSSKKKLPESEKGILLLIIFFVASISLAIVLGVSIILFSGIKMVRNIGNSVVAFYAADTGLEKTLYYDRKQIPVGGARGLCDICNSCLATDCADCVISGNIEDGCNPLTCSDCAVSFSSVFGAFNNKKYKVEVEVSLDGEGNFNTVISSFGSYQKIARAIQLVYETQIEAPSCGGYLSGGYCWYAGDYNQSCNEVCVDKGGAADSNSCVWTDSGCTVLQYLLPSITCSVCYSWCPIYYYTSSRCFSCEDQNWGDCDLKDPDAILICACKN